MYRYVTGPIRFNIRKPEPIAFKLEKVRTLAIDLGPITIGKKCEDYDGSYIITPRVYEQTMETEDKHMQSNVRILQIPLTKVSNLSGGKTATIG